MEPLAVIGIGCRFPGTRNPERFWHLLRNGVDTITEVPSKRWNIDTFYDPQAGTPGKMNTRWGGFLEEVDCFEPSFFDISPREAQHIDPQQRLLLEVTWEALENAGIVPESLLSSQTGVFIGIGNSDYNRLLYKDILSIKAYSATGTAFATASNRLSYVLNLRGPSIAVDTACSSSLVAVHLACQSLQIGESNLCLVGGVNLILSPDGYITFSQARMMAADGRCKTFDASADGYVRGEGCGIVVLKRLEDALRDGDNIQAVIKGSAVNQDGLTNGLTAPNGPSQQAVIRQALQKAGVKPAQISYVEAHGTGTSLGDPIEVNSLKNVLIEDREPNQTCWIGSAKTNIGHLEAAAGIAGLIKVVLSLQHEEIPPNLHFKKLNPYIKIKNTPIEIPTSLQKWSAGEQPRLAGISSFGFGGTNAHVILEEAPIEVKRQKSKVKIQEFSERPQHILTLSAKCENALQELVQRYEEFLINNSTVTIADMCFTANTGRSHFNHRLAIVASSTEELRQKLKAFQTQEDTPGVVSGQLSRKKRPKIAFLFTGQGSQYVNMARELYETQPIFHKTLKQCDEILSLYSDKSLLNILYPQPGETSPIDETVYTQPALFAIEYALAQLWKSWGIEPDVVMGHSVGEYVAATVAGVFSLEDGLKLIANRGRLMQELPSGGEMVAVMASESQVREVIEAYKSEVAIAAINGPISTVISGAADAIGRICDKFSSDGIKTKQLQVSHAFHSTLMEPMLAEFESVASEITYNQPSIPVISNLTGEEAKEDITTPKYWVNHVRQPVRFRHGMETLEQQGYEVFLEIGPKPILLGMGRQCFAEDAGIWLPSLRPGYSEWQQMLQSLAELYVRGVQVDWSSFDKDYYRSKLVLPTYPFQRQRYWIETDNNLLHKKQFLSNQENIHPLLGQRLHLAGLGEQIHFESQISASQPNYLKDHCVFSKPIFPATAYLEMAIAAGATLFNCENLILEDVVIQQALILPDSEIKTIQTVLTPQSTQTYSFQIFSQEVDSNSSQTRWTLHVEGKLLIGDKDTQLETIDLKTIKAEYNQQISPQDFYQEYKELGIDYGSSFQAVQKLWRNQEKALGKIQLPDNFVSAIAKYQIHPVLLDASFQVLGVLSGVTDNQETYLPVAIKRLKVYRHSSTSLWSQVEIDTSQKDDSQTLIGEVHLLNEDGKTIATVEGLTVKKVTTQALLGRKQESVKDSFYEVEWRKKVLFGKPHNQNYLLTPEQIDFKVRPQVMDLIGQPDLEAYNKILTQLEILSVDYVLQAFKELGWEFQIGESFSTEFIAQKLGIIQPHSRLLGRLLEMLSEVEILKPINDEWEVIQTPLIPDSQQIFNSLLNQYPIATAELTLLERCASQLANVLRGECDPVQLVFPQGDLSAATQLYQESPGAKVMNTLVQQTVLSALEKLPKSRGLRFLEIGAGTGGTTAHILPHLNPAQTEYVFTDIGSLFISKASDKFRDYPFVSYQSLDIEQDPSAQGFESHQYDLIIAANVLHATQDLSNTLQHVQQLLAPQGMLILLETTARQRWLDLIFGLLEGWWRFTDVDLRSNYPLLSTKEWQKLLRKSGFQETVSIPDIQETNGTLSEQAVILAQREDIPPSNTKSEPKSWLILADQKGIAQNLAFQLQSQKDVCILVKPGKEFQQISPQEFTINSNNPLEFEQLLLALQEQLPHINGVIQCWSLDETDAHTLGNEDLLHVQQHICGSTLSLVQALVKINGSQSPHLWLVTSGAQPVPNNNPIIPGIVQSSLWGMGKVIALEHPELQCVRVDLDPNTGVEQQAKALWEEIYSNDAEDQIAIREQERYVARLIRHQQTKKAVSENSHFESTFEKALSFNEDVTYLITGGLGSLGLLVAEWMVERGARHLVLLGRSGASDAIQTQLKKLEQAGAKVVVYKADISDAESITQVLSQIEESLPPLRGIIHSVGVLDDGVLQQQTWDKFSRVMAPKVQGAWNLHNLTLDTPLDFFVLLSSAASLLGSPGQANHSAANAFLDAFAYYRRSIGLPGLSINLGAVAEIGAAAKRQADKRVSKKGIGAILPQQFTEALEIMMSNRYISPQVGFVPIRWSQLLEQFTNNNYPYFYLDFVRQQKEQNQTKQKPTQNLEFLSQLEKISIEKRQELVVIYLQNIVKKVLQFNSSEHINPHKSLNELGLDSLTGIELRNQVESQLGLTMSAEMILKGASVIELAEEIAQQLTQNTSFSQETNSQHGIAKSVNKSANNWINYHKSTANSCLRLFCFHNAGGNASVFKQWSDFLPPDIEVCPIQLPGRAERIMEEPFTQFLPLIQTLEQVIINYLDKPFAFYSHSGGNLISFELAHILRQHYGLEPIHLFAGAFWAPHTATSNMESHFFQCSEEEILNTFLKISEVPRKYIYKAKFVKEQLPILIADNQFFQSYTYSKKQPLNCPISVFGGTEDPVVNQEELIQWSQHTTSNFKLHMLPGKHMFLKTSRKLLLKIISQELMAHLSQIS